MKESEIQSIEAFHKEIDLIQSCIVRMGNNSFLIKGWNVSLIAVILALAVSSKNYLYVMVLTIMININFWYVDAFFLRTEKKYRKLYEWVLKERSKNNRAYMYSLETKRFDKQVEGVLAIMFSKTLIPFYVTPIVLILTLLIIQYI